MSDKPITIVHIINSLNVGGAERVLSNLVMGMDAKYFRNIVISLQDLGHWGSILQQNGIEVYALHMSKSPSSLPKIFKLWRLLRTCHPDYIQGWMYHANLIALIIGKLAGVKHIYWNIRCSLMDLSKYKYTTTMVFNIGSWVAKIPTAIINNSRVSIQQHSKRGYNNKRLIYIPNGIDIEKFQPSAQIYHSFRQKHNLPEHAYLIGIIARYDPMKDHATFLRAAGILAQNRNDVYFVCAGKNVNSSNMELTKIINVCNIVNRVLLFDQVQNMQELYPALDYLTQTSVFGEGFPNVVAEAMACGVECFVTDVGDSLEVIGDTGHKIDIQDPEALAMTWRNALANKDMHSERNPSARQRIVENFSMQKCISLYNDQYAAIDL